MCLDEGDGPEEGSRTEDSEPIPSPSHAWAPGCVPVVNPTPPPHPISKEVLLVCLSCKYSLQISTERLRVSMTTVYICLYICF